ncbi:thymidine phosphorylase-like [Crassostrea angulata]|uniref:thymidine phosphorylase-like n=1 Tax=Magallana angulata TaxID=2784310 RepID=UPI0022B0D90D|nr:thymidine phosphorylase-like [Crassostrea angulata]
MDAFAIPDLIIKKRNGQALTTGEIKYFIQEVVKGEKGGIQQCQLGAMLMAIYLKGLTDEETVCLTREMINSGDVLGPWPEEWKDKVVDKHSTGGVGDKVSLILAPALAACGMKVPMVSGRGLGHTGGTLDKLESIPGFTVDVSKDDIRKIVEKVGCCIVGQTKNLVPADKEMYKVRDVTGTVDTFGLIAGSIISKKAAEQPKALVLDVKFGIGAVIQDKDQSRELARKMVTIGKGLGVETSALLTDMNNPIGKMIGNALEVVESIDCLYGNGPRDLEDLVLKLGGQLMFLSGNAPSSEAGETKLKETLNNGSAAKKFEDMIIAQGADPEKAKVLCDKNADVWSVLPKAKFITPIKSQKTGYVNAIQSRDCAECSLKLGAGRQAFTDPINYAVGLEICVDIGCEIKEGDPWIKVHHDCDVIPDAIKSKLMKSIDIQPTRPKNILATRVSEVI